MTSVHVTRIERDTAALVGAVSLVAAMGALAASVVAERGVAPTAAATLLIGALVATHKALSRWHVLVGAIVLLILFIPIKRYKIAAGLPFDLEPYRILLALVVTVWLAAALTDPKTRLRGSFLDKPLLLILLSVIGSILFNTGTIGAPNYFWFRGELFNRGDLAADTLKKLIFLLSFFLFFYLVVSVIRDERAIHAVIKTLVAGTVVVACSGIVEARSGYNVFDQIGAAIPFLEFQGALSDAGIARGGRLRVYASSQHPIALATMFVMVLPLALYLLRHTGRRRWAIASLLIGLGAVSTVSRTSVTTLTAVAIVFLWLRPRSLKPLVPFIVPALIVVHLALPGAIGGIRAAFFPSTGLIEDQTKFGGRVSGDRLAPEWARIRANPAFGAGYGTRLTEAGLRQNSRVLDDEWLGTTAETGLVGLLAWVWFFARFIRRAGREARADTSSRGWLLTALTAGVFAFAVSMLTFDAFSFIQVTFVLFLLAALGASTMASSQPWTPARGGAPGAASRFGTSARQAP